MKVFHCPTCIELVSELGGDHLILYTEFCSYYAKNGLYPLSEEFEPYLIDIVKDLEIEGYFVSRDIDNQTVLVKPVGHSIEGNSHYFCVKDNHL